MATATHSRTAANLTYASASETRACGRYLAFAAMAEEEGLGQSLPCSAALRSAEDAAPRDFSRQCVQPGRSYIRSADRWYRR